MSETRTIECNCCGEQTPYREDQRDEDGWYYCATCCELAE